MKDDYKEPRIQNIPIRTEVGKALQKAFEASRTSSLLSADYSELELRILARVERPRKDER